MFHIRACVPFPQPQGGVPKGKHCPYVPEAPVRCLAPHQPTAAQLVLSYDGGPKSISQNRERQPDSYRLLKRKSTLRESLKRHSLLVTFSAASFLKDLPCPSRSLQRLVSERLMSIAVRAFDFYPAEGHFYPRDARHENGHRLSVAPR